MMVGRWSFPFGSKPIFRGKLLNFRGVNLAAAMAPPLHPPRLPQHPVDPSPRRPELPLLIFGRSIKETTPHIDTWYRCWPKNRGKTPKLMVKIMENPIFWWMIWGENPTIFGNTHIFTWHWLDSYGKLWVNVPYTNPMGVYYIHFTIIYYSQPSSFKDLQASRTCIYTYIGFMYMGYLLIHFTMEINQMWVNVLYTWMKWYGRDIKQTDHKTRSFFVTCCKTISRSYL